MAIRESLENYIEEHHLQAGDQLPSEIILTKLFKVSRPTLREGFKLLQKDGMITTRNGAGTFLCDTSRQIQNPLAVLNSIGTMIQNAGFAVGQNILEITHGTAEPEWAERLQLEENEGVVVMKRLRTADDQPVTMAWNIFPERLVGTKLDDGIDTSIFYHLKTQCGIHIVSALTDIQALDSSDLYDKAAADFLGDTTILLKQLHFDEKAVPTFYSLDYIRTDMIKLTLQRERNGN